MKWGILATGNIAKKFASTINQMGKENEQLIAVGSRHIESAKAFAMEHDIPRYYESYEALVKDQDVEAVYVATPNTLHYENCRLCLEHGKHVLCEKPFTINEKQAQELYNMARDRHIIYYGGIMDMVSSIVCTFAQYHTTRNNRRNKTYFMPVWVCCNRC